MSFQPQNSSSLTSDDAQQICPKLLEEIANDNELKNLTQEEIETIFGGRTTGQAQEYGCVPPCYERNLANSRLVKG